MVTGRARAQRARRCRYAHGKVRFRSMGDASTALTHIRRQASDGPVRFYQCPGCDGWHLTSFAADPEVLCVRVR